jgi:multiple sugar transport system permease protein
VLTAVAALFLLPLWWILVFSLRSPGQPPLPHLEWWPAAPAWSNFTRLSEFIPIARQTRNSLLVGLAAVPLTLVTASWAGYVMARARPAVRRLLILWALLILLVPATALWLTRFVIFRQMGLVNSLWALIVPAAGGTSPLYALLFCWTFRRIPREVFEAARLEGAGHWAIWSRIALPLSRPTIVTVAVLSFSFYWSDLISPLLYLKLESQYTLPAGLLSLQQMDVTDGPLLMAGAVVSLLPVVLLFLLAHRFFWPDEMLLRPVGVQTSRADGESPNANRD